MAKSISNPNIAVTVSTGDVQPKVDSVNKALGDLSSKPIIELKKGFETNLTAINKDIKSTVENLYKLRAELAKGGDSSKIQKTLQNQLGKIGNATGASKKGVDLAETAGTVDDLFGGKFDLGKAGKFGIAGIVASLASDMLAGVTDALVKAKDGGGGFGDYAKAIGDSLPIVGGILKTVENIDELWSGVRAEAAAYQKILELSDNAGEHHAATMARVKKITQDTARSIADQVQSFNASQRGGVQGQVLTIRAQQDQQLRSLTANRDQNIAGIEKTRDDALKPQQAALKTAKTDGQRRAINANIKQIEAGATAEIDAQNKAYDAQVRVLDEITGKRVLVTAGITEDTKAVEDQLAGLEKQTRTATGDPFEAMRKSFKELKPTEASLAAFEAQLAKYQARMVEVEAEQRKFNATKAAQDIVRNGPVQASLIGLNDIDRQIQQLVSDGVTDKELLAKVRVTLETDEAKRRAQELKDVLQGIGANIQITLARDAKAKIAAEIDADSERRKAATGQGYTDAEKAQLQKAKEDQLYAGQAAQTREAVKETSEKLADSIDDLKEQFARGYITDAELSKGVGQSLQGYADSMKTSRPDLVEYGSAAAQQLTAVGTGAAIDASRPELVIAREQKDLLGEIRDAIKEGRSARVSIGG